MLFKMAPRHIAEVLPTIPKSKDVLCHKEKILMLHKLHLDTSYSSDSYEFNVNESMIYIK